MERDVKIVELDGKEFVPKQTCYMKYDYVHEDIVCSNCGTAFYDGTVAIINKCSEQDNVRNVDFKYCPVCGARVSKFLD